MRPAKVSRERSIGKFGALRKPKHEEGFAPGIPETRVFALPGCRISGFGMAKHENAAPR
jgi:hypothetical protein